MVNEILTSEKTHGDGFPRRYTIADTPAIPKGTLLKFSDPHLAAASDGLGDPIAGITVDAKVADNGITEIAAWTDGIAEIRASGAITTGQPVISAGVDNMIRTASDAALASGAAIIGWAEEDAEDKETIRVRVRL